ncbi:cuticle protein 2-like [Daktulosphaira vitifoliae]|uniref:cuticle protein 2-like n=1 Tax=Daktulosphaira vitifoliae TaxID=58002 RepID=UPI0021AB03FD|nr:cuticle protein 2-like [Daktulosphaira vitifoliae]
MHTTLVVAFGLMAVSSASPSLYFGSPQFYGGYYPAAPVVSPIKSQYHTQNELGHYSYGYNDGYSSKTETKHANGLTEGSYSYVDPNGVLQQYKYESDENGYRVSGTNLPESSGVTSIVSNNLAVPQPVQDTPEVVAAKAAHLVAYEEAKKASEAVPEETFDTVEVTAAKVSKPPYGYPTVYTAPYSVATPYAAYGYAPVVPSYATAYSAKPYVHQYSGLYSPVNSQYHTQDEFGQYSYGYSSDSSSKSETKTLDGVTRGGYSYVDANGILQQYQYVSDPINGFRISGTNLPSNSL